MHHDNYDANVKMTLLEDLQVELKDYENKYTGNFDSTSAIQYSVLYQRQALTELLQKELSNIFHKDEYIENIVDLACIKHCKKVVNELATKYVTENVMMINNLLKNTHIKEYDLMHKNEDAFQAYYNTEVILDALTYKDDLIASFERFLKRRNIKISLGNPEYRFCFTFTQRRSKGKNISYYCNNIYEFLDFCLQQLLDSCYDELISLITTNLGTIPCYPKENYDLKKISVLKGKALYEYLNQFEFIQINYDLEDLYLLLYYEDIAILKNNDIMESLKLKIIHDKL